MENLTVNICMHVNMCSISKYNAVYVGVYLFMHVMHEHIHAKGGWDNEEDVQCPDLELSALFLGHRIYYSTCSSAGSNSYIST